jgi:hypothetical protein
MKEAVTDLNRPARRKVYLNYDCTMYYSEVNGVVQIKVNLPGAKWRNSLFTPYDLQRCIEFGFVTPSGLELV